MYKKDWIAGLVVGADEIYDIAAKTLDEMGIEYEFVKKEIIDEDIFCGVKSDGYTWRYADLHMIETLGVENQFIPYTARIIDPISLSDLVDYGGTDISDAATIYITIGYDVDRYNCDANAYILFIPKNCTAKELIAKYEDYNNKHNIQHTKEFYAKPKLRLYWDDNRLITTKEELDERIIATQGKIYPDIIPFQRMAYITNTPVKNIGYDGTRYQINLEGEDGSDVYINIFKESKNSDHMVIEPTDENNYTSKTVSIIQELLANYRFFRYQICDIGPNTTVKDIVDKYTIEEYGKTKLSSSIVFNMVDGVSERYVYSILTRLIKYCGNRISLGINYSDNPDNVDIEWVFTKFGVDIYNEYLFWYTDGPDLTDGKWKIKHFPTPEEIEAKTQRLLRWAAKL